MAGDCPFEQPLADEEYPEQCRGRQGERSRDVPEHVVAELVSENEERLRLRHLRHRRVPDDDALRRPDAGDVGVHRLQLVARLHLEHAFGLDRHARALDDSLHVDDELRRRLAKRPKLEEQRRDHQRLEKQQEDEDRLRDEPEDEPPASGRGTHHRVENRDEERGDREGQQLGLRPVPEP